MKRNLFTLLLVFCLIAAGLSGCGKETEDRTKSDRDRNTDTERTEAEGDKDESAPLWDLFKNIMSNEGGPHVTYIDPEEVSISEKVQEQKEQGGAMQGYLNIALFGVDARNEKELYKSSRSDTIMIASINMKTGDIKLVSVYRDTYLNLGNDAYQKCNAAYSKGGAQQAIQMLNMNLDMDITTFITVGYSGLAKVIDSLGGIWIDVDKDEIKHINNYQYSILGKYAKQKYDIDISSELNFTPDEYFADYDMVVVDTPGYQLLNGLQAAAYCRIRYVGNDFARTGRQREVLKAMEAQAKQADLSTLTKAFNSAADSIYTNLDTNTILELLANISKFRIVDESGFPELDKQQTVNMGANGICGVPMDLESSVGWLHEFLFDDETYQASDIVSGINTKIRADADKYRRD